MGAEGAGPNPIKGPLTHSAVENSIAPAPVSTVGLPDPASAPAQPAPRRRRLTRWLSFGAVLVSVALAWLLSASSPLRLLELKMYDLRFVLSGSSAPPSNIVLIVIDPRTEAAIPDPRIFWHPHYASVLRAAAQGGARAIGLDVSFALSVEKWAPDYDRELAAAFAEVMAAVPVVLAYDSIQATAQGLPLYLLASAQGTMGFANFTLDADNFVRRQELVSRDEAAWESFAARLAAVVSNAQWGRRDPQLRTLQLGDRTIPLDASGFLLIHYWGPAGTFPMVSMADVLSAAQKGDAAALEKWFRGKVVLIGTLDPSDEQPTPFYLAEKGQRLTAGVEIQANTLATLLEGHFLREASPALALLLVLAGAALAALCGYRVRFSFGSLLLLGLIAGYLAISVYTHRSGLVLPVVPPVLAMVLAGFASYGVRALTEGRQRRLLQEVFGRYVSAEMARELLDYGEIPLGGTRQPVTVMFSDLRNFTSYCQGRDSHQVVEELNEYFSEMTSEIKAHGGMINKFIGDGIMALFGAPVPHADDALRAVACALRMVQRNREFNQRRTQRGQDELVIGIGLHTGEAVVGTIGAPEKMEYTAIGDTVNVASRIEGENKTFSSRLLISEATYQLVRDRVLAELAGHAKLRGVAESMPVYKVIGLR